MIKLRWPESRIAQLGVLCVATALVLAAVVVLPEVPPVVRGYYWILVPSETVRRVIRVVAWVGFLAAVCVVLTRRPKRLAWVSVPERFWDRTDECAEWLSRGWITVALAVLAGWMFATWAPHYLTWPWWCDIGYFAVSAQAWDAGIKPYRDMYDFNFPGPIYVHWVLGKLFGWGRSMPFTALDAALVASFGLALVGWSRARFGGATPGLIAFLALLYYYLNLDYRMVAQRDWHAPLLAAFGLLALEARRGWGGLALSAVAFSAALSQRPHVVLFLPAYLSAIDEHARAPGEPLARSARGLLIWVGLLTIGVLTLAAPVVLAGVSRDFAYWFGRAWYGGGYNRATEDSLGRDLLNQLRRVETVAVLVALGSLMVVGPPSRRSARTWALALLFVLLYRPLSPVRHDYLTHPVRIVESVAAGAASAWLLSTPWLVPSARVVLLGAVLWTAVPQAPRFCLPGASLQAVADLAAGRNPVEHPPGTVDRLPTTRSMLFVSWPDYCDTLAYLRERTTPRTRVANFFRAEPFPAVNAPTGRLTPFPSPAGILWLRYVAPEREAEFADRLERDDDTVVVWTPRFRPFEKNLRLERIERTIRHGYRPEVSFGPIEIWRRIPAHERTNHETSR